MCDTADSVLDRRLRLRKRYTRLQLAETTFLIGHKGTVIRKEVWALCVPSGAE